MAAHWPVRHTVCSVSRCIQAQQNDQCAYVSLHPADPLIMIQSGDTKQVMTGVTSLAASAQVLGVLSVARALSECKKAPAVLSNEVFLQVCTVLLKAPSAACRPCCHV